MSFANLHQIHTSTYIIDFNFSSVDDPTTTITTSAPDDRSIYWAELHMAVQVIIYFTVTVFILVTFLMLFVVWHAKDTNKRDKREDTARVEESEAKAEAQRRRHIRSYHNDGNRVGGDFFVISETSENSANCADGDDAEEVDSVFENEVVFTPPGDYEVSV